MAELLDDPGLSQRLGEAGRRRLREEFSADIVVPRIEAVYRRVAVC
jgi:glycosyltransferase involved in cell wall biosynthesis